jgi:hypothetical protein
MIVNLTRHKGSARVNGHYLVSSEMERGVPTQNNQTEDFSSRVYYFTNVAIPQLSL